MNKLLEIFFVTLTILASVTTSNGGTYELTKLLENKDFWSTYKWETFEESELYKSTTWKLTGGSLIGNTKIGEDYTTSILISNLNADVLTMFVDFKTKEVQSFRIYSINNSNSDDYTKFVSWCNEKFGDVRVEHKVTENHGTYVKDTMNSSWTLENTVIRVRTEPNLTNPKKLGGFITTLSFANNYRPPPTTATQVFVSPPTTVPPQSFITPPAPPPPPPLPLPPQRIIINQPTQAITKQPARRQIVPPDANIRSITPEPNAVKHIIEKQYLPPPYIWENELGTTNVTNEILNVPENKRAIFEINVQK